MPTDVNTSPKKQNAANNSMLEWFCVHKACLVTTNVEAIENRISSISS